MRQFKCIFFNRFGILFFVFVFIVFSNIPVSADGSESEKKAKQQNSAYANAEITIKIIPSENNTFGYDILLYGRPLVHQPSIPGLPGNEGFSTREKAQKAAEFVVNKIRKNEMPPTVSIEDLNNMGVLK